MLVGLWLCLQRASGQSPWSGCLGPKILAESLKFLMFGGIYPLKGACLDKIL